MARKVCSIARLRDNRLNGAHRAALAALIESGPIPAVHGVVRWRIVDLCQWIYEEFRVVVAKQTLSRELRAMGYRKLSARPRHHAQATIAREKGVAPDAIEIWFADVPRQARDEGAHRAEEQDHSALGQARRPAQRSQKISEPPPPISSARSVPRTAKARPSSCRAATRRR
jgi:Winged helix-turn helix